MQQPNGEDGAHRPGRAIVPVTGEGLTRRTVIKYLVVSAAGAGVSSVLRPLRAGPKGVVSAQALLNSFGGPCTPSLVLNVVRREDLLNLRFELFNLVRQGGSLVRQVSSQPAYVVVQLAPQHITEEAFFETDPHHSDVKNPSTETPPNPPVKSLLAGPSRLVFTVPDNIPSIPFELPWLLDWVRFQQKVAPAALPPGQARQGNFVFGFCLGPRPANPGCLDTAIEAPWNLILSPNVYAAWAHDVSPVHHGTGRTELWHTRLGVRAYNKQLNQHSVYEGPSPFRTLRAIWSPDYEGEKEDIEKGGGCVESSQADQSPFRMSLSRRDRYEIVELTSNFCKLDPKPIRAERVMLSALGAWMNVRGAWQPPADLNLEEWRHQATMGRDHYVRVVYKGFLFPFGHRAALIKVTERKFFKPSNGQKTAYLRQRMFIVVRQPEKEYDHDTFRLPFDGREMPFKSVRITSLVTPNLDQPGLNEPTGFGSTAFWPHVSTRPFRFSVVAEDWDGQRAEFTIPLIFVKNCLAFVETSGGPNNDMNELRSYYNGIAVSSPLRQAPLQGQKVAFAKTDKPGDTALETDHVVFGAAKPDTAAVAEFISRDQPLVYPLVKGAKVRMQAAEQVKGAGLGGAGTFITLRPQGATAPYDLDSAANAGKLFCRLVSADLATSAATALGFDQSDKSGGLATPNMAIGALSRTHGPVGGNPDTFGAGSFDPSQFFSGAKILGGLDLFDVVKAVAVLGGEDKAPKIVARNLHPNNDKSKPPTEVEVKLTWKPEMKSGPPGLDILEIDAYGSSDELKTTFDLLALFKTDLVDTSKSTYEIVGDLRRFRVNLFGKNAPTLFIALKFKRLVFTAKKGTSPDIDVDIDEVKFEGVLKFVESLKDYLKFGGSGLSIDVLPTKVTAGLSIGLPTITVGLMTLSNMSFSAGVNIPFTGEPVRARFSFCSREAPFMLVYTIFGGGGFFAIELGTDGVELFEMALEFGAGAAIDIGVASGQVKIVAGIYFKIESGNAALTGYVRLNGSLEILGLISLSLEFYMSLTYDFPSEKTIGQATLTVKVEVLIFSASVSMTVERRFGGSGDPNLLLLMPPRDAVDLSQGSEDWDQYAAAFATAKTPSCV